jgi:hypothetical protein
MSAAIQPAVDNEAALQSRAESAGRLARPNWCGTKHTRNHKYASIWRDACPCRGP